MNASRYSRSLASVILLATTAVAAEKEPPAKSSSPATGAARFQQVRDRAAALYEHRNQLPPAPLPEENPFRPAAVAGAEPGPAAEPGSVATPMPGDLALLQLAAASLHVNGTVEMEGDTYLVINTKTYRVGDIVQTKVQGETVYLRLREIDRNSYTLALNETEMTLTHRQRIPPR